MSTVRQALQSALGENGGRIPFDVFMGIALHHAEDGYYARNIRAIGRAGDFTTVPQLSPELGRAIGRWLRDEAARRGWTRPNVIECGPGSGALAAAVLKSFPWWNRSKIGLRLVETSRPLRAEQHRRGLGTWHSTIGEALAAGQGSALVYHNEFLDAFPCRVFRRESDGWTEMHLAAADGRLQEIFIPPERPRPASTVFEREWPTGQRVEVFASAREWMSGMAASWKSGAMLVVDYGGRTDEIYHRRPAGTVRAYRGQQRLTGHAVYEVPGRQDITADVNFDDLAAWARELGWQTGTLQSLEEFAPGSPGAGSFRCLVVEPGTPGEVPR